MAHPDAPIIAIEGAAAVAQGRHTGPRRNRTPPRRFLQWLRGPRHKRGPATARPAVFPDHLPRRKAQESIHDVPCTAIGDSSARKRLDCRSATGSRWQGAQAGTPGEVRAGSRQRAEAPPMPGTPRAHAPRSRRGPAVRACHAAPADRLVYHGTGQRCAPGAVRDLDASHTHSAPGGCNRPNRTGACSESGKDSIAHEGLGSNGAPQRPRRHHHVRPPMPSLHHGSASLERDPPRGPVPHVTRIPQQDYVSLSEFDAFNVRLALRCQASVSCHRLESGAPPIVGCMCRARFGQASAVLGSPESVGAQTLSAKRS